MFCSKCGFQLIGDEKFCGKCGNKVVAIPMEKIQEIPEKEIQKEIGKNKTEQLKQSKPTSQVFLKTKNDLSEAKKPDRENEAKDATIKFLNAVFRKNEHIQKNKIEESKNELHPQTFELKSDDILKTSESINEVVDSIPEISKHKKETTSVIENNKVEKTSKDFIEAIFEKLENSGKGNSVLVLIIFTIVSFVFASYINHSEVLAKFLVFIPAILLWYKWLRKIEFF